MKISEVSEGDLVLLPAYHGNDRANDPPQPAEIAEVLGREYDDDPRDDTIMVCILPCFRTDPDDVDGLREFVATTRSMSHVCRDGKWQRIEY